MTNVVDLNTDVLNQRSVRVGIDGLVVRLNVLDDKIFGIDVDFASGETEQNKSLPHGVVKFFRGRLYRDEAIPWSTLYTEPITEFELSVYKQLEGVPSGETVSYGQLAERLGKAGAAQAVGQALKRNPFPIVIPCHRVIRSSGATGGFGGNAQSSLKKKLLSMEAQRS